MKSIMSILAAALVVCSLAGCQSRKKAPVTDDPVDDVILPAENALTIQSPHDAKPVTYPILSAFYGGNMHYGKDGEPDGSNQWYCFYREKLAQPQWNDTPLISISGVQYKGVEYSDPVQWITLISIDESVMKGLGYIVIEDGHYKGLGTDLVEEVVEDVQINSFQSRDIDITITTKSGEVVTLLFAGSFLHDERM